MIYRRLAIVIVTESNAGGHAWAMAQAKWSPVLVARVLTRTLDLVLRPSWFVVPVPPQQLPLTMTTVEVSFVYLEAAPTRDALSSNPFHDGYPIELKAKDQIQEFSRQIMADYDVVDAMVYQV